MSKKNTKLQPKTNAPDFTSPPSRPPGMPPGIPGPQFPPGSARTPRPRMQPNGPLWNAIGLAKQICDQNARMHFEETNHWNSVTTEDIIEEAEKLYQYTQKKN